MGTFNSATTMKIKQAISTPIGVASPLNYTVPANSHFDGVLVLESFTSNVSINIGGVTSFFLGSSEHFLPLKLGPGETITVTVSLGNAGGGLIGTLFENAGAVV